MVSMRELIAGEGGSVLVEGSQSPDVVALACEGLGATTLTPSGIPVYPIDSLPDHLDVDRVRIVSCEERTRTRLLAWAKGVEVIAEVIERSDVRFGVPPGVRVVTVSASSTGSGKTALTRRVARTLLRSGVSVVVARHPIANLLLWDRFGASVVRTPPEVNADRPLEEREELAPVVGAGIAVVTGLDPQAVLRLAATQARVIVWDGGGAAEPWVDADIRFEVIDLLRAPQRIRRADVYVLTKADSASAEQARSTEALIRRSTEHGPDATVILADLAIGVRPVNVLADKRVVIVEDANSLILGGLSAGAGAVAARRFRCGAVDPRPFAVGAIAKALREHPHIGAVIPSLGRTPDEIDDLARSVRATPGDAVLWASNADPTAILPDETRPIVRAFGELTEVAGPSLQEVLAPLLPGGPSGRPGP